jgi:F-type H+-transporting ATPase subunit b
MGRGWLTIGFIVFVLLVFSSACLAAEELEEADPNNFFKGVVDVSIWTIVVFLVLLFVLGKYAWPLMREGLDKREQAVASALENAQRVQADAERLRIQLEQDMKRHSEQIRGMLDEARRNGQQLKDALLNEGRAEIQDERDRLRREIQTAQDQALAEIWSQAGHLATLISAKAIRRQLTEDDHRRLVDEALSELRGAAVQRQRGQAELS